MSMQHCFSIDQCCCCLPLDKCESSELLLSLSDGQICKQCLGAALTFMRSMRGRCTLCSASFSCIAALGRMARMQQLAIIFLLWPTLPTTPDNDHYGGPDQSRMHEQVPVSSELQGALISGTSSARCQRSSVHHFTNEALCKADEEWKPSEAFSVAGTTKEPGWFAGMHAASL